MSLSKRAVLAPLVTAATVAALVFGTGAITASAVTTTPDLTFNLVGRSLTLPNNDGFNDNSTISIASDSQSEVEVSFSNTDGGAGDLISIAMDGPAGGPYTGSDDINTDAGSLLPAGTYTMSVQQDSVSFPVTGTFVVGTGIAKTVTVATHASSYISNSSPDVPLTGTVTAKDETGTSLPITGGTLNFSDSAGDHTGNPTLESSSPTTAGATFSTSVAGWDSGTATFEADNVTGPDNSAAASSSPLSVGISVGQRLTGTHIAPSVTTVYPVKDGYRDTVTFTVSPAKTVPTAGLAYKGTLVVKKGSKVVKTFAFTGSSSSKVVWNGRVGTKIVTGSFGVVATLKAGTVSKSASTSVTVSSKKLHKKTLSVTEKASTYFSNAHQNAIDAKGTFLPAKLAPKLHTDAGDEGGSCNLKGSALVCAGTTGSSFGFRVGYSTTPSAVRKSTAIKNFAAKLTLTLTKDTFKKGKSIYFWSGTTSENPPLLKKGTVKSNTYTHFPAAATLLGTDIAVGGKGTLKLTKVKMTYTYYILK